MGKILTRAQAERIADFNRDKIYYDETALYGKRRNLDLTEAFFWLIIVGVIVVEVIGHK